MNYEKKYKEALERASKLKVQNPFDTVGQMVEHIFPELKESEDKRMLREIKRYIQEQGDKPTGLPNGTVPVSDMITWLEKQGENKPTDKIEPKFKVGDFIINDYCLGKVIEITNDAYLLDTGQGIPFSCEHNAHLWTIQDAKDGDVLVNGSNIFIFHFFNSTRLMGYCHVNIDNGRFYDDLGKNECFCLIDAVVNPATKEQRDLLFQKMKEAGYEWDSEKKELKKIEVASKESEDERIRKGLINGFKECLEDCQYPKNAVKYWHDLEVDSIIAWLEKQTNKD